MSWKIFTGIEAEGPYINSPTIFLEGYAPFSAIASECFEREYHSLYFGARYKKFELPSLVDYSVVAKFVKANTKVIVDGTLHDLNFLAFIDREFSDAGKIKKNLNAIITIYNIESLFYILDLQVCKQNVWVKFLSMEKQRVTLTRLDQLQVPDKSLYEKDELLVEGE